MSGASPAGASAPLSARLIAWYAVPNLALAVMHMPVYLVLPAFYAKNTQIGLAAIGTVLMIGRLYDGLIDPFLGYMSDRTTSRLGRRKPWVLAGLPLAVVSVLYLFSPPATAGTIYFLFWSVLLFSAWSMIDLAYQSWGVELAPEYRDRTRLMTARATLGYAGAALFMAAPMLMQPWTGHTRMDHEVLQVSAWFIAVLLPLSMMLAIQRVPNGVQLSVTPPTMRSMLAAIRVSAPLRLYLGVSVAQLVASGSWSAVVMLYVDHMGQASQFGVFLLAAWLVRIVVAPLWMKAILRLGKHRIWAFGCVASAVVTPLALLVQPGPSAFGWLLAYALVLGFLETAWMVAPVTAYGDVIDYGTLKTGAEQAGLYYALSGLMSKVAMALGGGVAFWILALTNYQVKGQNTEQAIWGLYIAFAIFPSLVYAASAWFVMRFPIDEHRHGVIRRRIETRARRAASLAASAAPASQA